MVLAAVGCGGGHSSEAAPQDPFAATPVSFLPTNGLAGSNVLLLVVGGVVVGDSGRPLPTLETQRTALLGASYAALDTALRRDGREVNWFGLEEQQRVVRRNPTLGITPDRFATAYLIDPLVERIPDPLWGQVRTLAAITGARYIVVPAAVRVVGSPGALEASYLLVLADARSGLVAWRGRIQGQPAPTAEAALTVAANRAIASPLH